MYMFHKYKWLHIHAPEKWKYVYILNSVIPCMNITSTNIYRKCEVVTCLEGFGIDQSCVFPGNSPVHHQQHQSTVHNKKYTTLSVMLLNIVGNSKALWIMLL